MTACPETIVSLSSVLEFGIVEIEKYWPPYPFCTPVEKLKTGETIDEILDKEDPFESLEPILPEEVYPVLVLAMINNIRSETVMEALIEGFNKGRDNYKDNT